MDNNPTLTAFSKEQYDNIYPEDINNHYWNDARNSIIESTLRQNGIQEPILEIGCGRGAVISYLYKKKFNIQGIEIAKVLPFTDIASLIRTESDAINVENSWARQFKTILLLDVIEHIEYPDLFLSAILNKYENVKKIIVAVPAGKKIWSNYDVFCGHFRRYDLRMIDQMAMNLNLSVKRKQYFFHLLYLPARFLNLFKIDRSTVITPPRNFVKKSIHKLIARSFNLESKLLPKNWKGSSIITVLERK